MTPAPTTTPPRAAPPAAPAGAPAPCAPCAATVALTGLTREQFAGLVDRSRPVWRQRRHEALARPGRRTPVGSGRKYSLPFEARLFLTVVHERWEVPYRTLGALFGVGSQTVQRACRDLRPLLAPLRIDRVESAPHRSSQRVIAELERAGVTDRASLLRAVAGRCERCPAPSPPPALSPTGSAV